MVAQMASRAYTVNKRQRDQLKGQVLHGRYIEKVTCEAGALQRVSASTRQLDSRRNAYCNSSILRSGSTIGKT